MLAFYVVNALKVLEAAGPIKSSSPVYSLFQQLQQLIWQRTLPFYLIISYMQQIYLKNCLAIF